MSKKSIHIIALGGSVVAPETIDVRLIKRFRDLLKQQVRHGQRFIVVIGGGGIARIYQRATSSLANKAPEIELDTVGMRATRLNAELVRVAFGTNTHPDVVDSPEKLLHLRDPIAIAAGWMPGYSTDTVAVRIAEEINAKRVIIAGHPAYVYDRDISRYADAKPLKTLTWQEYRRIVPAHWRPGMPAPVDPVAAVRAERMGITALVVRAKNLANLASLLNGRPFRGTVIQ